ncbi:MAG: hypothetical protein MUE44_10845 [Oscillatoriaceae cyanobacterium Prado104]|jgi:hypothetical protein|nr:hypothetical protein [Oscillatoriaceae cyanobacterium Prado104]
MKENQDDSMFTELTLEEAASVNGACHRRYYNRYRSARYNRSNCYSATRHVVYRRNCDGSFRAVYRYW